MSDGKLGKMRLRSIDCVQQYLDNRYISVQHLSDTLLGQLSIGIRSDGTKEIIKNCMKYIKIDRAAEDPKFEIEVMQAVCTSGYPYFVKLIDAVEDDDLYCTILEYVPGGDLFNYIQSHGPLSITQARKYGNQLAQAISTLHSKGYCHLDISLENVLIDHDQDCVKLCDFGLSRKMNGEKPFAPAAIRPGKKNYLAPEIYNFESFYGSKCDVFSLGVLFFIILTGFPPFNQPHSSDKCFQLFFSRDCTSLLKQWKMLDSIPKEARDLFNRIFVPASQRISIKELLDHPWLLQCENDSTSNNTITQTIESFESLSLSKKNTIDAAFKDKKEIYDQNNYDIIIN